MADKDAMRPIQLAPDVQRDVRRGTFSGRARKSLATVFDANEPAEALKLAAACVAECSLTLADPERSLNEAHSALYAECILPVLMEAVRGLGKDERIAEMRAIHMGIIRSLINQVLDVAIRELEPELTSAAA